MGHARCCDSQMLRENKKMRRRDSDCKQGIMGRVWLIAKRRKSKSAGTEKNRWLRELGQTGVIEVTWRREER